MKVCKIKFKLLLTSRKQPKIEVGDLMCFRKSGKYHFCIVQIIQTFNPYMYISTIESLEYSKPFWTARNKIYTVLVVISPLHNPVTWQGINYAGRNFHSGTFKTKEPVPVQLDFLGLKVPQCNFCPSIINSIPRTSLHFTSLHTSRDRIAQRAYPSMECCNDKKTHLCGNMIST